MSVLTIVELERLLFEDAPYGDLTTEALRIGDVGCRVTFVAPSAMTVAAIEDAAATKDLLGHEATLNLWREIEGPWPSRHCW